MDKILLDYDDVRKFLVDWEEHHTLSRNLTDGFVQSFGDK
jgi:hypothetical protein